MKYRNYVVGAAVTGLLLSAGAAFAAEPAFGGTTLRANPTASMSNMTLTVTGPNGFHQKEFSTHQSPFMSLSQKGGLADGLYKWELTGATSQRELANPMGLDNGRGASAREYANKSVTEYGNFRVLNGSIVAPDATVEGAKTSRYGK